MPSRVRNVRHSAKDLWRPARLRRSRWSGSSAINRSGSLLRHRDHDALATGRRDIDAGSWRVRVSGSGMRPSSAQVHRPRAAANRPLTVWCSCRISTSATFDSWAECCRRLSRVIVFRDMIECRYAADSALLWLRELQQLPSLSGCFPEGWRRGRVRLSFRIAGR